MVLTVLDAESISERHQSQLHQKQKAQLQYQRRRWSWKGSSFGVEWCLECLYVVSWFGLMLYLALFELSMSDVYPMLVPRMRQRANQVLLPSRRRWGRWEFHGISIDDCWCFVHLSAIGDHVEWRWFVPPNSSHTLRLPVPRALPEHHLKGTKANRRQASDTNPTGVSDVYRRVQSSDMLQLSYIHGYQSVLAWSIVAGLACNWSSFRCARKVAHVRRQQRNCPKSSTT